jgi:hypothetical protein
MRDLLLEIFAITLLAMIFSATVGSGEFYNKCMKRIDAFVHCDTVEIHK